MSTRVFSHNSVHRTMPADESEHPNATTRLKAQEVGDDWRNVDPASRIQQPANPHIRGRRERKSVQVCQHAATARGAAREQDVSRAVAADLVVLDERKHDGVDDARAAEGETEG